MIRRADGWRIHIQRKGTHIEWWVYHSGYGSTQGLAWTRSGAEKAAKYAIGDFIQGL
jgi:hypothetical protein